MEMSLGSRSWSGVAFWGNVYRDGIVKHWWLALRLWVDCETHQYCRPWFCVAIYSYLFKHDPSTSTRAPGHQGHRWHREGTLGDDPQAVLDAMRAHASDPEIQEPVVGGRGRAEAGHSHIMPYPQLPLWSWAETHDFIALHSSPNCHLDILDIWDRPWGAGLSRSERVCSFQCREWLGGVVTYVTALLDGV